MAVEVRRLVPPSLSVFLPGKVSDGGSKEYLGDGDPNLVAGNDKGNVDVNRDDCGCLK